MNPDDVWLLRAIEIAQTAQRLELLGECVKLDKSDGAPYTKDPELMGAARAAWLKRMKEIKPW